MLNHIVLIGRLVRDPELKHTGNGIPVCTFRIAVDRDQADKETGRREADFVDIVTWRTTAKFAAKYFHKGSLAAVSGRLQIRSYDDKNGERRSVTEVVADEVYFGDSAPKDRENVR